jgi:hypothetical protein
MCGRHGHRARTSADRTAPSMQEAGHPGRPSLGQYLGSFDA